VIVAGFWLLWGGISSLSGLVGSVNSICTYPARSLLLHTNLDAGDIIASVGLLCLVELR
jgi:hypothetical protein